MLDIVYYPVFLNEKTGKLNFYVSLRGKEFLLTCVTVPVSLMVMLHRRKSMLCTANHILVYFSCLIKKSDGNKNS